MKRSLALQPLSREHHTALTLAKACERAAQSGTAEQVGTACHRAIQAFTNELEPQFQIVERSLVPLLLLVPLLALLLRVPRSLLRRSNCSYECSSS